MVVIVAQQDAGSVLADLKAHGEDAYIIGSVRTETSPSEERVSITGTPF